MKRRATNLTTNRSLTKAAKLFDSCLAYVKERGGCCYGLEDGSLMAFMPRKFTVVRTMNPDGFQPLTKQEEVVIPVPVLLQFDRTKTIGRVWLSTFQKNGGTIAVVSHIEDATEALHG